MTGLYIAMILDYLQIENLSYEILEASDRVGGRVYTHYFSKEKKHDYYDVSLIEEEKVLSLTFVPGRSNAVSQDTNHGKVLFPLN